MTSLPWWYLLITISIVIVYGHDYQLIVDRSAIQDLKYHLEETYFNDFILTQYIEGMTTKGIMDVDIGNITIKSASYDNIAIELNDQNQAIDILNRTCSCCISILSTTIHIFTLPNSSGFVRDSCAIINDYSD